MKSVYIILLFLAMSCSVSSCKKFLDVKPDKKQVIPVSMEDCQALLNNSLLGGGFSGSAEVSTDDYYLTLENWNRLDPNDREPYLWLPNANISFGAWSEPYGKILIANQILETLSNIKPTSQQQNQWDKIKGAALMLRSVSYFSLSQLFTKPYNAGTAGTDPGVPIRLSSSIDEKIERGNLQRVYDQMIQDFTEASALLPAERPITRISKSVPAPVKSAAYAGLARVYLTMGDYGKAFINADAALKQYNVLMDYKTLDPVPYYPIQQLNAEVIYNLSGSGLASVSSGYVTQEFYDLYEEGDIRKTLFFRANSNGTFSFKGTYVPGSIFSGFATDELYLIRAECSARAGNTGEAMKDLNTLRQNRWDNTYAPIVASDAQDALRLIIRERRKELPFRTLRWTDLRRLGNESDFVKTLTRTLDGKQYSLPRNDLRYTFLIPREVLDRVSLPQNPR